MFDMSDEDYSAEKLSAYDAPMMSLPYGSLLRGTCINCGLERVERIDRMMREGRLGRWSCREVGQQMTCSRMGCDGRLEVAVELPI